jgi:glyoxylase-like metal-dependent hydrolase (beta-lactamase superfamily II)
MKAEHTITVHRFEASLFPVNAYLVETDTSVIVVDATLGVSDGKTLRSRVEALRKPLAAIIITHAHPTTTVCQHRWATLTCRCMPGGCE